MREIKEKRGKRKKRGKEEGKEGELTVQKQERDLPMP